MSELKTENSPLILLLIIAIGLAVLSAMFQSNQEPDTVFASVKSAREICFNNKCHEEVYFGETASARVFVPSGESLKKGETILLKKTCGFSRRFCGYKYLGRRK